MSIVRAPGVLLVCMLGCLSAALTQLTAHYVLFSGQMLRLPWTGAIVVAEALHRPAWLGYRFRNEGPSVEALSQLAALGVVAQLGCLALAWLVYRRARARQASTELDAHKPPPVRVLAYVAVGISTVSLCLGLAPTLWGIERAYWLVRLSATDLPDLTAARKASMLAESLAHIFGAFSSASWLFLCGLVLLVATGALAGLAIAIAEGLNTSRALAKLDPPQAQAWRSIPAPPTAAVACVCTLFIVCGAAPVALGTWLYSLRLAEAITAGAALEAGARGALLLAEQAKAHALLDVTRQLSCWATLLTTLIALYVLNAAPARARRKLATTPPSAAHDLRPGGTLWPSLAIAGASALVLFVAAPYAEENHEPLAADPRGVTAPSHDSPALRLVAPDRLESAPSLALTPGRAALDERAINAGALTDDLLTLKRQWLALHPSAAFVGTLTVACGAGTRGSELVPLLHAARRASYSRLQFVFGAWQVKDRPVLGWTNEPRFSAAHAELVAQANGAQPDTAQPAREVTLELGSETHCDALSRRLVTERLAGRTVRLHLAAP
jgi:hypothetical protein